MSPDPAERVLRRIEHAGRCVDEFKAALQRFIDTEPYEVSEPEMNPTGTRYYVRLHIRQEPPFELGLIIADAIHNLRATLDNMVFYAHRVAGVTPPRGHAFPIGLTSADFAQDASWMLAKMPSAFFATIESLQPYHRPFGHPERHAAAILNRLWTADKHRATPVTFTVLRTGTIVYNEGQTPPNWQYNLGAVPDKGVMAFCDANPTADMTIKPGVALDITIHGSGTLVFYSASDILGDLYKYVRWEAFAAINPFLQTRVP